MFADHGQIADEIEFQLFGLGLVDAIWIVDLATMNYVFIIGTKRGLRGFEPGELINSSIRAHCTPSCREKAFEILGEELLRYRQGERVRRTFDVEMYHKDGNIVTREVSVRFYQEKEGELRIMGISKDILNRESGHEHRNELIVQLELALAEKDRLLRENKILMGLLPICSICKKIRDNNGKWWPIEQYIASRTEAQFTHTICPVCRGKHYPAAEEVEPA